MRLPKQFVFFGGSTIVLAAFAFSLQQPDPVEAIEGLPAIGKLGGPRVGLTAVEQEQFMRGRKLFDKDFHKSDGVGTPEMNADSCRACHQDPAIGGAGPIELNVSRFGFDDDGAGPFADLPGGQGASKLRPPYIDGREEIHPNADCFEQRQTPSVFGDGLIDEIFEASIIANEDPTDTDMDGVYGVARMINTGGGLEVGRFGWKAQIPKLADFVKDAMAGECGITTPDDGRGFALLADADGVPDPELTQAEVDDIAFFMGNLAAPARAGGSVAAGEALFTTIGCATCHVPSLNGPDGPVPLYSNLLLHDVMPADYRGMSEPGAEVGFFKTPPLWGIRHTAPYMHDGRASTLRAAIEAHFTEAEDSKNDFLALSPADQAEVIAFLEDL